MTNHEIAQHFSLLAKLTEIHGGNSFKAKSYANTAFTIDKLREEITGLPEEALYKAPGIGQSAVEKIRELLETGQMEALTELLAATPEGILEMMRIKGLGPKKIAVIWKELGVETIGELEYACAENRLAALKGFGPKTQETLCRQIEFYRQNEGLHLWASVEPLAHTLLAQLQKAFPKNQFALTGELRRQLEIVAFIEILCDLEQDDLLRGYEHLEGVSFDTIPLNQLTVRLPNQPALRFHFASPGQFYKQLFLTTGSEEFVAAFLEQYHLPDEPQSETEIFRENRLDYIEPALRETAGMLERAASRQLPLLIQHKDIRGIIHSHSTYSDGAHTLEEMARGARDQGFEYLVISDHSQAAQYAGGLSPERIRAQHQEIDALNEQLAPFKIFKSIEADILGDGSLDYNAQVLSSMDLVIASVHSNLQMSLERAMDRVLTAVRNPFTTILGHMTGRLLLSRAGYPLDHKKVIDACAAYDVAIEINAHPRRLDIDWRWIEYALEKGVLLSINPDAHSIAGFADTYYGVMIGQKGGLTARQNLSSFSRSEFESFLLRYRAKVDQINHAERSL